MPARLAGGLAIALLASSPALAAGDGGFGVSEFRLGVADHDTGTFGASKEEGSDVVLGLRFTPLTGGVWDDIWNPRPHVGANINTRGDTSSVFATLTWGGDVAGPIYLNFDLGGAVHDGETSSRRRDRKELGTRALFYLAAEVGFRFFERHGLSLRVDHMSNANIADNNEGLDTVGVVYSYFF